MEQRLRDIADRTPGFMPPDEGLALYKAAEAVAAKGPLLEIGTYCGKSAVYLGAAARARDSVLFTVDHHRGSEEHQPGEGYHDPDLTDSSGRVDTLPAFRATLAASGLGDSVVGIIGHSETVAEHWRAPLALLFIDGSHSAEAAHSDYENWVPHVILGGLLAVHDVFEDPSEGGRPPFEIYRRALESGAFAEVASCRTLRVLERVADGL